MGTVSSQFTVTAIADGATIHGSLVSNQTLTQIVGTTVTPNWETPANQPTLTLRIMKGSSYLTARNYKWYINGLELTFDPSTNLSTTSGYEGYFLKGTTTIESIVCPTLKIVKNLGGPGNLDLDIITVSGQVEVNAAFMDFTAGIEVKISRTTGAGYIGSLGFVNNKSWIDTKGEYICIYGLLATDGGAVSGYSCRWFKNYDEEVVATSRPSGGGSYKTTVNINGSAVPCLYLYEGDVEDFTIIRCAFIKDNVQVATETANIDDEQDPDQMYITYGADNVNYNGIPASLKSGSVTFYIWMALQDDPNHTATMQKYTSYKVKLLNSAGETITGSIDGYGSPDSAGFRDITRSSSTLKASCTVSYNLTVANGGRVTGIVKASTT